ncbi:ATP-binding cassette domain-containing protein [Leptotrichia sp. OH3620_COT-345]|nr:ATP-binding cassette domain-containing protein [Leptotrichia sp. OH3620_COT-345]
MFSRFFKYLILSNISFFISEGECLGIMQESDSGKSTLVRLIVDLKVMIREIYQSTLFYVKI